MSTETAPKIISLKDFKLKREFNQTRSDLDSARSFACKIHEGNYPLFTITLTENDIRYIVDKFALTRERQEKDEYFIGLLYADYFAYLYDPAIADPVRDELLEKLNSMPENSILEIDAPWHSKSLIERNTIAMIVEFENVMWHFKNHNVFSPRFPAQMFYELYEDIQP